MKTWLRISTTLCAVLIIVGCNTANNQQETEEEVSGEETQEDSSTEQMLEDDEAVQEGVGNEYDRLAVDHEFTKSFLVDTDVEPGFHQMRGKLDGFEMVIPENGIISDLLHAIENNAIETLIYTFNNHNEQKQYHVKLMYYRKYPEEVKQNYLNVFKDEVGFDGEYQYEEANDLEIYHESYEDDGEYGPVLKYFSYIFSKHRNQAISYEFIGVCQGGEECSLSLEEEAEMAEKLMYSIRLLDS